MSIIKRQLGGKKANPKFKFNVMTVLKETVSDKKKRKAYSKILQRPDVKREFGQRVVDRIRERAEDGLGIGGWTRFGDKDFASPYSESYSESFAFKAFGKSKNDVNLELTGDMMASLFVAGVRKNDVIVSFDSPQEGSKARGHIVGDNPNGMPRRDFFGLPDHELKDLMEETIRDFENAVLIDQIAAVIELASLQLEQEFLAI